MKVIIPEKFIAENDRITELWLNSEQDIEEIIDQYASEEYKRFWYERKERKNKLRKAGIIVD